MKKIVPFNKNLMFKTKIGEITSISIDNTLKFNDDIVSGEFIIDGLYKMLESSNLEEKFIYRIPVDIAIDNKYDTTNCTISIDDFTYEIINEDTLKVNISVLLDDLDIKDDPIETIEIDSIDSGLLDKEREIANIENNTNIIVNSKNTNQDINNSIDKLEKDINDVGESINSNTTSKPKIEQELFNNITDEKEYSIYRVYTVKEEDSIDVILDKFNITRDILSDYNDLENLRVGMKIIIPSTDE